MANKAAPKPLVAASTPIEKAIVAASIQVSPEVAAKNAEQKRKRQAAENKVKKSTITSGALSFVPVLFNYADGKTQWISMPKDNTKKFGIVDAPEGTLSAGGQGITKVKTKTAYISYGFKIVTRKKSGGARVTGRGGSAGKKQVRAWISISIPVDATFLDFIAFAKTLPKKPGIIKLGTQQFMMDYKRAIGGAGAAK
jgi:hypothetical protein